MKKLNLYHTLLFIFSLTFNALQAQTCNDPNAHNFGEVGACETCFDFVQNGDETGVDCGGTNPNCAACIVPINLEVEGKAIITSPLETDDPLLSIQHPTKAAIEVARGNASGQIEQNESGGLLKLTNTSGSTRIQLSTYDNSYFNGGNVGIGDSSPNAKLEVSGDNTAIRGIIGLFANSSGSSRAGVEGSSAGEETCYGMFGSVISASSSNAGYGVYGTVSGSGTNYAGYFSGNLHYTGSFTNGSDRKLKKNIKPLENSLDKVMRLQPKRYEYNRTQHPTMNLAEGEQLGFIAQDLQKIFPELVSEQIHTARSNSLENPDNEIKEIAKTNFLGVEYIPLIPVLTKAIQEQQEEIEVLKGLIETLLQQQSIIQSTKSMEAGKKQIFLFQNRPNPFTNQTEIHYDIPISTNQATIHITDLSGKILNSYPIQGTGKGNIVVQGNTFAAGIYMYSLDLDGELVTTKKMVLTK